MLSLILATMLWGKTALEPLAAPQEQPARIKNYGLKPYVSMNHHLPHSEATPWKLVCEMPYNCQFQPSIDLDGPAGKEVNFNSSNPLVLYLTATESCTTQAGDHTYEAKNWISGEGAVYTIPAGVTVKSVRYRETGYDTSITGSFECNDEDYNILWRRAARTAYLCMRDHFYDCPDRERVGFWGDGTPELDQCFYIFDPKSHAICRELVKRQLEPDFYPGQHLEFLGEYGLWFYYMQTGDKQSLVDVYEPTKNFLLHTYKFGNKGTWFDWGNDNKDTSVIENCFMVIDLKTLKDIAVLANRQSDLPEIDKRLNQIRSTFDQKYWKGGYYQSIDVTAPDDRANAMAVLAGLATPDKWDVINQNVLSKTTNSSCFFDRWVFEALCKMGRQDQAMLRMSNRYRTMIESSFTSLWEHYDRWWASWLNAFDEGSSLNHGWNPPAILLSHDIAGVRPLDPGWGRFEVFPKESFLKSIKVTVPTVKGLIKVEIRKSATTYEIDVQSPSGCNPILGIPKSSFMRLDSVRLGDRLIMDARLPAGKPTPWKDEDGYFKFEVAPGHFHLKATGSVRLSNVKSPRPPEVKVQSLDNRNWTAQASVPDSSFLFSGAKIPIDISAMNAIDGDHWTGWRDMTQLQHPGQWFEVDMKRVQSFNQIELDNTWALYDYPRKYEVSVSTDGKSWSKPIATGAGQLGINKIRFQPQKARWIRITQTGSDPTYHWSIYDLQVQVVR